MERKIIFTQPLNSGNKLQKKLEETGFSVLRYPMIETKRVEPSEEVSVLLKNINSFSWLIFTSKNAIRHLFALLEELEYEFPKKKIAVVGEKTAKALKQYGYQPDYVNLGNTAHELVGALSQGVIRKGSRVLAVLGNLAPDTLEIGLKDSTNFNRLNIYHTMHAQINETALLQAVQSDSFQRMVFTSPSAILRMHKLLGANWPLLHNKCICIGSVTGAALIDNGVQPLKIAEKPAEKGLYDAILASFE